MRRGVIAGTFNPAFADPGDAGVIFHHGTVDRTVPFAFAVAARDAMLNAGLPVEWHEYPGEAHEFSTTSQATIETTSIRWLYDQSPRRPTRARLPSLPVSRRREKDAGDDAALRDGY